MALNDCLLVLSEEDLSLAAMEAMSARCNVVTSAIGGAMELLNKANCGAFYSPASSPKSIAQVVIETVEYKKEEAIEWGYRFCLKQTYHEYRKRLLEVF